MRAIEKEDETASISTFTPSTYSLSIPKYPAQYKASIVRLVPVSQALRRIWEKRRH